MTGYGRDWPLASLLVSSGEMVKSCTIIVTDANKLTSKIHDRMPVILSQFEPWLAGTGGVDVLRPAPEHMLQMWPVSRKVTELVTTMIQSS